MEFLKDIIFGAFVTFVAFLICAVIALAVIYVTEEYDWFVPITFFGTIILCNLFGMFSSRAKKVRH